MVVEREPESDAMSPVFIAIFPVAVARFKKRVEMLPVAVASPV